MKWPLCATRKGLSRLLISLVLLGAMKLSLLICLSLFEGTPPSSSVALQGGDSGELTETDSQSEEARSWPVKTARAQEPKQGAEQSESSSSLSAEWEALRKEKRRLQRRKASLEELEKRLDEKLAREKELKAKLEQILKEAEVMKDEKIKHLVDVYSNMQPEQAAKVLETLDKNIAVKILAGMRGRTAGEILSFVEAEKAARLSEQLTDFQTPFARK